MTVEKIPIGAKEPNTPTLIGQVAICAPVDAEREPEICGGTTGEINLFISEEKMSIPANAP